MPVYKSIKKEAKLCLQDNWLSAVAVISLPIALVILWTAVFSLNYSLFVSGSRTLSLAVSFLGALMMLLSLSLMLGSLRWFCAVANGKKAEISEVFYYYSSFGLFFKSIALSFVMFIRALIFGAICFLPFILISVLQSQGFYDATGFIAPTFLPILWPLTYVFFLFGMFCFIIVTARTALAPMLFVMNDDVTLTVALKSSKALMEGKGKMWLGFLSSMFGWLALGLLGVPLLYTLPSINVSLAVFAKFVVAEHRAECEFWGKEPLV